MAKHIIVITNICGIKEPSWEHGFFCLQNMKIITRLRDLEGTMKSQYLGFHKFYYFLPWESHEEDERQKDRTLKDELPRQVGAQYATEIRGEITPERMKRWSQSENNTQLWMWLVMKVKSDAVKSNITEEPGMSVSWIEANRKWPNRRWQKWTLTF